MKDKVVLVTGISGFIGSRLAVLLGETFPGVRIRGTSRTGTRGDSRVRVVDLLERDEIVALIEELRPDYIFHLAGVTHTQDIAELYRGNVRTTVNLLEAIRAFNHPCRVIVPGSAAEYGQVRLDDLPIREDKAPKPISAYGLAKVWQTTAAAFYASQGADIVIGRLFNIIGKGMSENFSVGAFAAQLKTIQRREAKSQIKVGNLAPKRDFLDIDDVSRALIALAEKGKPGEIYNVCSGVSISMAEVLKKLIDQIKVEVEVVVDPGKVRTVEIENSYGSHDKIKIATGWRPAISLDVSVANCMS